MSALSGNRESSCRCRRPAGGSGIAAGRQRQAVRQDGLFQRGIFAVQPRDLVLKDGPILGHGLACPADGLLAAKGDLRRSGCRAARNPSSTLLNV